MSASKQGQEARALTLLRQLLDLPRAARHAALRDNAQTDELLRQRVERMLEDAHTGDAGEEGSPAIAASVPGSMGPYRLLRRIGQGGMGEVFLAERDDGTVRKQVALKSILGGMSQQRERFEREREILARLNHPHIAALYDAGVTPTGQLWFAMEHVQGETFIDWCDARRAGLEERVQLFLQVCAAVEYAHRNLVVHRDIKPANIMVSADGNVRLLDFGIAKALDQLDPTRSPTLIHTPGWAAPEQLAGGTITTATDVFQLGLVLQLLLSGLRPCDSTGDAHRPASRRLAALEADNAAQAAAIGQARGISVEKLRARLAGDLDSIIARASAVEVGRRYESVHALACDLQRWQAKKPVLARLHERGYRLRATARRYWPLLATIVTGIGLAGFHVQQINQELERTRRAQNEVVRERDQARAVAEYFGSMFTDRAPRATSAGEVSARELLEQSLEKLGEQPGDRSVARGLMLLAAGEALQHLGELNRAREVLEETIGILAPHQARAAASLARAHGALAAVHYKSARRTQAAEESRRALLILDQYAVADLRLRVSLLARYAVHASEAQGDAGNPEARRRLTEVIALTRGHLDDEQLCDSHISARVNLGVLHRRAAQHRQAERQFRDALDLAPHCRTKGSVVLPTRQYLAMELASQGRLSEASGILDRLVPDARAFYGANDPFLAGVLLTSAVNSVIVGDAMAQALSRLDEADRIYARTMPVDSPYRHVVTSTRWFARLDSLPAGQLPQAREFLRGSHAGSSGGASVTSAALAFVQCRLHPGAEALSALDQELRATWKRTAEWRPLAMRWRARCAQLSL